MRLKSFFSLLFATLFMSFALVGCDAPEDPSADDTSKDDTSKDDTTEQVVANPFTLSVQGSTIENIALTVEINEGVEVGNYAVGVIAKDAVTEATDSLAIAKAVVAVLSEIEDFDATTVDETYVFDDAATVYIAETWGLEYETSYYVVACEINAEGEITSGVNHTEFTTDAEEVVAPDLIENAFSFTVSETTTSEIKMSVTVDEAVEYYYMAAVSEDDYTTNDEIIESTIAAANEISTDLDEQVKKKVAFTESQTFLLSNMVESVEANTQYIFIVVGVNAEGATNTAIYVSANSTAEEVLEPELIKDAFTFNATLKETDNITIEVTPDAEVAYYYLSAISTKGLVNYSNDADYFIGLQITSANATSTDLEAQADAGLVYTVPREFTLSALMSSISVVAGTEYTFIAVGVNAAGERTTEVSTFKASTKDPLPANAFTFETTELTPISAKVKISPIEAIENYYVVCQPYDMVDQMGGYSSIYQMMIADASMMGTVDFSMTDGVVVFNGEQEIDPSVCYGYDFSPSTMYSIIVAGVDATGALTSEISCQNITTPALGGAVVDPFTLTLGTVSATDVMVTVTPDATVAPCYYVKALPKSVLDAHYNSDADAYIKDQFSYDFTSVSEMFSAGTLRVGEQTISVSATLGGMSLAVGTEYVFMALAVNAAGEAGSSMSMTVIPEAGANVDPFTLTLGTVSATDVMVTVTPDATVAPCYYVKALPKSVLDGHYNSDADMYIKDTFSYDFTSVSEMFSAGTLRVGEQTISVSAALGGMSLAVGTEYEFMVLAVSNTGEAVSSMSITVTL